MISVGWRPLASIASLAPPGDSRGRPAYSTSGLQHVDVHVAQREIARGLPEERREAVGNRRTAKRDSSCVARHVEQVTRLRVELVVDLLTIHAGGALRRNLKGARRA